MLTHTSARESRARAPRRQSAIHERRGALSPKLNPAQPSIAGNHAPAPGLHLSRPGDAHERDAEHMASQAMQMRMTSPVRSGNYSGDGLLTGSTELMEDALASPGSPLDAHARAYLERKFGRNFSRVRVHTGSQAAESAHALAARAYTAGEHVVFGAGQYAPRSGRGLRLLAHELAHVIQQADGAADSRTVQRFSTAEHEEIGKTAYEDVKKKFSGPAYESSNLYRTLQGGAQLPIGSNTKQYGDIVADGDFFQTFEDLIHESGKRPGVVGQAALDARNFHHFTPDNIHAWIPQHDTAVGEMVTAYAQLKKVKDWIASIDPLLKRGRAALDRGDYAAADALLNRYQARFNAEKEHKETEIQNAHALARQGLARNAFSEHFLTDAFSSGHAVTPRKEILQEVGVRLDKLPSGASLLRGAVLGATWGELGEVRAHARSLAWHDLDNYFGVEVKNKKPGAKPWIACGDNCSNEKLASHSHWAATHDAVVEATEESIKDLWRAGLTGVRPPNYRSVLDLVPIPTFHNYPAWGAEQWEKQLQYIRGDNSSAPAPQGSQITPFAVDLHPIEHCSQPAIGCYEPFMLTEKDWIRQYSFGRWVRPWIARIQATAATRYNF